ncbi:Complex I intermediate-associated protein 30 (CIA30) [Neolewinella agarilytica]|uniref:Complex I intermediate-associated protein 30 (CIA30) n=2 Tax=Neolewinella agarilytica TaxID=478744 RepID=A0A1H9ARL7_9BACT|nr:Complex I intermediate-associated protein 30 (CIA30) [Neolewinella agarilytica]
MHLLLCLILLTVQPTPMTIFDFTHTSDISNWSTVDDTVMGGRSDGHFRLNEEGHGEYSGRVSLENNGGFSSLRYRMPTIRIEGKTKVRLRLRGDGKRYQFRVKTSDNDRHSYVAYFETSGEWEEVVLDLKALAPQFRGRPLNMENYPAEMLSEMAILIGNKKEQTFKLELDWLRLE